MRFHLLIAVALILVSHISSAQSDETIQMNVQKALEAYSIKTIAASVNGGVVNLTGLVAVCSRKILADQLTSGVTGVKSIWDRVEVAGPNVPDNELRDQINNQVKDRIRKLGGFGFGSISVDVKNGVVTLSGSAAQQLGYPAKAEVADTPGVKNLIDHIKIVARWQEQRAIGFQVGGESSNQGK